MCLATAWIASSAAAQYEAPGPAERCKHVDGQSLQIVADGKWRTSMSASLIGPFEVKRFQTIHRLRCR